MQHFLFCHYYFFNEKTLLFSKCVWVWYSRLWCSLPIFTSWLNMMCKSVGQQNFQGLGKLVTGVTRCMMGHIKFWIYNGCAWWSYHNVISWLLVESVAKMYSDIHKCSLLSVHRLKLLILLVIICHRAWRLIAFMILPHYKKAK